MIRLFVITFMLFNIFDAQEKEQEGNEKNYFQPVEEFFITESVYPQEQFEIQFTFSPILSSKFSDEKYKYPFSFEYGITNQLQIEAGIESSLDKIGFPENVGEFEAGLKYSFMNINEKNIHTALAFEVEMPLNEDDENIQLKPSLILAYDFLNQYSIQIFTHIGYNIINNNEESEDDEGGEILENNFDINSGLFISLGEVTFVNEFSVQSIAAETNSEIYLTPGIVYSTPLEIEIGAAGSIGLNNRSDSFRAILSFVYEL